MSKPFLSLQGIKGRSRVNRPKAVLFVIESNGKYTNCFHFAYKSLKV